MHTAVGSCGRGIAVCVGHTGQPASPGVPTPPPPSHLPKPAWHPCPQCCGVPPHQPLREQQSPKAEPRHVNRDVEPHEPSDDTSTWAEHSETATAHSAAASAGARILW